jgi:N,N'-diacetylchitobiose phosphorylase
MQFGFFDDKNKEYVIERPDTPKSWSNYLGSTEYGAIITNNAGGYSFYKSAAQGRFMRLRFNSVPVDQPGRYIYIHDKDKKDYWSTSWQPVGKKLENYSSICKHGTAYTIISSNYDKIETTTNYFVPLKRDFEFWHLKVKNNDKVKRNLRLFTFVEYSNNWHILQDFMNLQYTQYILRMSMFKNIIDHGINVLLPDGGAEFENHDGNRHTFLGIIGKEISGFDTDRDIFLGNNRSYHNPLVVEKGVCTGSLAYGDNGCGVLQIDLDLEAGETTELAVVMGIGKADQEGISILTEYNDIEKVNSEFEKLKAFWHIRLQGLSAFTPDAEFNSMTNVWSPYNCMMTYSWSRAASLIYSGERDGLGYRDTVQDILGVLHLIPNEVGKRLELMITGQVSTGGAMPVVKQFSHTPGNEVALDENEYRSDDCLWLFNTIPAYVKETGNIDFYNKILPYSDAGEDSVFNHLKKAIQFSLDRLGIHGLPYGLAADWNDCLQLKNVGESAFVAFQLRYALLVFIEISDLIGKNEERKWAKPHLEILDQNIQKYLWDGKWFIRAIYSDGMKIGSDENDEGKIWLNPQTWSVISNHASSEQAKSAMKNVNKYLFSKYGIGVCAPPYEKIDTKFVKAPLFNQGMKENASIFSHTQGWAVIAETMLGNGDLAYQYYRAFMPAAYNSVAEIRQIEPYVNCQFTHSKYSPRFGASRLPWLTGAATWSYFTASQFILGIQPQYFGLKIDPCIPSNWDEVKVFRKFREKDLHIRIINNNHVNKGVEKMILNDKEIIGNHINLDEMKSENFIEVFLK